MSEPDYLKGSGSEPITRSLNALALLASGDVAYLPLVKREAEWAAGFSADNMQSWRYGYVMMLLAEYTMATDDQSVMPGLRRLALETAQDRAPSVPGGISLQSRTADSSATG